jgi:hypothetical protein
MFDFLSTAFLGSIGLVTIGLQIACLIHALKSGRPYYWFWIIIAFPVIGIAAYFFVEIRPNFRRVNWNAIRWRFTGREERIRVLRQNLDHSSTIRNRYRLADELIDNGQSDLACQVLIDGKSGVYADDAELLLRIALCHLDSNRPQDAHAILEQIKPLQSADYQFQYRLAKARVLADSQATNAEESLKTLTSPHRNEGPHFYLARYLIQCDRSAEGKQILEDIFARFRRGTTVWRFQEQAWYQRAKTLYRSAS